MAKPEPLTEHQQLWADFFDPISVRIVSIVTSRLTEDGKLLSYDGIDAAREIRDLLVRKLT
jgi:hypothetical protein